MSKFIVDSLPALQNSIHKLTYDIEKKKIRLRIGQERYTKRLAEFKALKVNKNNILKNPQFSHRNVSEAKESDKKKIEYNSIMNSYRSEDLFKKLKKNHSLGEIRLTNIKRKLDIQTSNNENIKLKINEFRSEKYLLESKLQKIHRENKTIAYKLDQLIRKNKENNSKLNFTGLKMSKEEGKLFEEQFKIERDNLEKKYHKIIELGIEKIRDKSRELSQKRLLKAKMADDARNKVEIKEDLEKILDRMPILDSRLEKWNSIIKIKRYLIQKHALNAHRIKYTLDKLILYLGLTNYKELPNIYYRDEEQISKLEKNLTEVKTDVDNLKEKKILLEKQINMLKREQNNEKVTRNKELNEKELNIKNLRELNDELYQKIEKKRKLFKDIEESTLNFLKKLQGTYLTDFLINNLEINKYSKINENNVMEYLSLVYCYIQLIDDFYETSKNKFEENESKINSIRLNRSIENLKKEIKFKLSKFDYNTYLKKKKKEAKSKNELNQSIKNLANEFINQMEEINYNDSNTKEQNTNESKSRKKTNFI